MAKAATPAYRADIDGLRAIAIIAVLLFHGFPKAMAGGFVGVDIFFVISGYLISGVILESLRSGTFRYSAFYARRIRRIFPALTVVLAGSLVLGWAMCFPHEYRELGKHVIAGAGFVSNIALWREAGYFDAASENKPLLHLWSLGIEEQFYILWPVLLAFVYRKSRNRLVVITVFSVASFSLNVLIRNHRSAVFYLPVTRAWELLIGAALAMALVKPMRLGRITENLCSAGGLALMLVAAVSLNSNTVFPGWAALLPTLGAAAVIVAGTNAWFNRAVLAHPSVVYVGLVSYPLYLWHWPLLTFARWAGRDSVAWVCMVLLLAVLLASGTYHLIETPIRFGRFKRTSPGYLVIALTIVISGASLVYATGGRQARLSELHVDDPNAGRYFPCSGELSKLTTYRTAPIEWCTQSAATPPTAAVFGDSHARSLFPRHSCRGSDTFVGIGLPPLLSSRERRSRSGGRNRLPS